MASSSSGGVELKKAENMAAVVATVGGGGVIGCGGVAMTFPVNDSCVSPTSPSKIPRRLRRRLSESRGPSSVEEIEAKLKEATLRRQQFYDYLSSKARPRQKSPSRSSSQDEDRGQRIEAKLNAAEQKRSDLILKAQMRLARYDEQRGAAKNWVAKQVEKKRGELGMKVESRVQQAEANRLLIMKSRRQRRAARKERRAQFLTQRLRQESEYKECVLAAIHQKRAAAERKRLGLLEAERSRAHARSSRVQTVANSINTQREMERIKKREQLEDRLQRARRQRAEFLRQRKRSSGSPCADSSMMQEQVENLARKLARCWRQFVKTKGTTYDLAKTFWGLKINEKTVKSMPFEQLAFQIGSDATLKAVKSFLDRLEVHLRVRRGAGGSSGIEDIDRLLKRVATPKRKRNVSHASRVGGQKRPVPAAERSQNNRKLSRYPVRIVLCAYMILGQPDAVLSGKAEHETALAEASVKFIQKFELLIKIILEGCCANSSLGVSPETFKAQLEAFDKAWCSYLYCFVVWKVKDAKLLEEDLVRAACQLELSMMHTCKVSPEGAAGSLTHDMKAIQKQVIEDQILLKEKVHNLCGIAGIERMENALSDVRDKFLTSKDTGSPFASPVAHIVSPDYGGSSSSSLTPVNGDPSTIAGGRGRSSSVVRSLFKEDNTAVESVVISSVPTSPDVDVRLSNEARQFTENEVLVNEIVHAHRKGIADSIGVSVEDDYGIKAKIEETMEKAFWDGVMESVKQEHKDFSWILKLMTEVRDELCEMAPASWREEITNTIDIDILTQVLRSGTLDMNDLGNILEYALITLQKLSAPAKDDEMKAAHQNLLNELREISQAGDNTDSSAAVAMIKGLRFVLQHIQILKKEISRARIGMLEPMIKGPAGLEYLQKAFSDRYGLPSSAWTSLPLTKDWLSLVNTNAEQVWSKYMDLLLTLPATLATRTQGIPPVVLRTGGRVSAASRTLTLEHIGKGKEQSECKGDRSDLLIRVGLLKLVSEIEGLKQEALPETLKLNVSKLNAVRSLMLKIIVISTSILVLRQTLLSERLVTSPAGMETIISRSAKQLSELPNKVVGIEEIVEAMIGLADDVKDVVDLEKLRATRGVVMNMLSKSLQFGDAIFVRVSQVVHLSATAAVLGGTGSRGRLLAETALRRVGAAFLTDKVMEAAETLIVVATVSGSVHEPWYEQLLMNL